MQWGTYAPRFDRSFSPRGGRCYAIGLVAIALLVALPLAARGQGTGQVTGQATPTAPVAAPGREPIKLRDHKRVAIAAVVQRSIQLHSLSDCLHMTYGDEVTNAVSLVCNTVIIAIIL
jgi:hypothetical protein